MKKQFTEEKPDGYTGLLLIRCERCGQVRAFYTKNPLVRYYCRDCGRTTPLGNLIPAYARCGKCGAKRRYLSNCNTPEPVSCTCINCQAPIDLQLNKKKGVLETL